MRLTKAEEAFNKEWDQLIAVIQHVNDGDFSGYPTGTLKVMRVKCDEESKKFTIELAHDPQGWSGVWGSRVFPTGPNFNYIVIEE